MSEKTAIGWTDHTYNPWWGCTKVSAGCRSCYAETLSTRWGHKVWGPSAPRRIFGVKHWNEPHAWNIAAENAGVRRRVFCGSMCDVFEDRAELAQQRERLWKVIDSTPALDWLLLTKRPENIARMLPATFCHENVWLGTSVEDQAAADERIPHLLELRDRARVLFLSCEPLIDHVMLCNLREHTMSAFPGIGWVIIGGESGPGFRQMTGGMFVGLAEEVISCGVPLFVKQDSGLRPGLQGGIPDHLWARKEFPR